MATGDPGTRTAPLMTASATDRIVTLHMVDASGDLWAEDLRVAIAAAAATIETWAAAYQAGSQASLWKISDHVIREGAKVTANANFDQRNSVKQGVNMLYNNPTTHVSFTERLVAPVTGAMQGDDDIPIVTEDPIEALIAAVGGLQATSNFTSAQYTERRERQNNPRVSA